MQMLLDLVVNIICKNVLREVRIWHPLLFIKFLRSPNQFCTFNIAFIGVVNKLFITYRFRCVLFIQIRFLFVSGWCESFWTALSTAQECDTMIQEYLGETQAKPNQPVLTWSVNCWAGVRTETVYLPAFCYQCDKTRSIEILEYLYETVVCGRNLRKTETKLPQNFTNFRTLETCLTQLKNIYVKNIHNT